MKREEADRMALEYVAKAGTDCVGVIDTEEKMAAALIYVDLQNRGLLISTIGDNGPVSRITPAGRLALDQDRQDGRGR